MRFYNNHQPFSFSYVSLLSSLLLSEQPNTKQLSHPATMADSPSTMPIPSNESADSNNEVLTPTSKESLHQPEASAVQPISSIEQGLQTLTFEPQVTTAFEPHSALLRSAHLLKSIFHIFRCYTSFGAVETVSHGDGALSFSRSNFHETTETGKFIWADQPFGSIAFDGEDGENDLDTIISANECYKVVAFMGKIISTVLKGEFQYPFRSYQTPANNLPGQYTKLEAVAGTPINITRPVNETMLNITRGPADEHWVILITTLDNQVLALDLTGAQYGWNDLLTPWDQYANAHFSHYSEFIPLDHVRHIWNEENLSSGPYMKESSAAEDHVLTAMDLSLKVWSKKEGVSMLELLGLGEEEFVMKSFEIVLAAVMAMESLIGIFKRKKMYLWYEDGEGGLGLTGSLREARMRGL